MVNPGGQNLQRALWSSTAQGVLPGQVVVAQGSWHLYLMHECPLGQPLFLKQMDAEGLQPVVQMQTVAQHLSLLVCRAERGVAAGVLAPAVVAGLVGGTVIVDAALNLAVGARELALLVDHQAVLAGTGRLVAGYLALLVQVTRLGGAGVVTLAILCVTSSVEGTVRVGLAASSGGCCGQRLDGDGRLVAGRVGVTSDVGKCDVALRTLAAWLVDDHIADGVLPTCSQQATRSVHLLRTQARLLGQSKSCWHRPSGVQEWVQ